MILQLFLALSLCQTPEPSNLAKLKSALRDGDGKTALSAADELIKTDPKKAELYFLRAGANILVNDPQHAVDDFSKFFDLSGKKTVEALSLRGGEYFKLGKIKESIADFDEEIQLRPETAEDHWRRGISLYYADRFEDGAKQFELGKRVYGNDVENAFWHFLCLSRKVGAEKARKELLKVGQDSRYYMPKVYEMLEGKAKPAEVIEVVDQAKAKDKTEGYFYANLYVGLYLEATGEPAKGLEYIRKAKEKYVVGHYMYSVAAVHVQLRGKP